MRFPSFLLPALLLVACSAPTPGRTSASRADTSDCMAIGGSCLSSPVDVTYPANCSADYHMDEAPDISCAAINQTCCVPRKPSCDSVGGTCRSSPSDVTYPADCAAEFGEVEADAACAAINQSCCVSPTK